MIGRDRKEVDRSKFRSAQIPSPPSHASSSREAWVKLILERLERDTRKPCPNTAIPHPMPNVEDSDAMLLGIFQHNQILFEFLAPL